ncbi:MAG: hypothetical protein KBS66_00815 [Eubacterium sp.]|nr:hypothetical protein [Candidatus Colimonas fimequi]
MTSKLLKYELKSSYQYMLIVWAAMIVASIGISLTVGMQDSAMESTFITNLIYVIPYLLYFAAACALGVAMIFVIVIRFYKGLLGDEGYLMHTLPVREWQLVVSRALAATIYTVGSILVVFISIVPFLIAANGFSEFFSVIGEVLGSISFKIFIIIVEVLILVIFSVLKSVYQVYAALAIGQLVDKYRILLAVGAYIGISVALTIIASVGITLGDLILSDEFMSHWSINPFESQHEFFYFQILLFFAFVVTVAQVIVFHIVTERILTKKLNLL